MNSQHSTLNPPPSIEVHIQELVLNGFAPGDRHRISAAVEQELTRLISTQPDSSTWSKIISLDCVDGGAIRIAKSAKPGTVGAQIAGAVLGGITR